MESDTLEMRRLSDGAVYRFSRAPRDGAIAFRREDKDIWILRRADFGWVVWDFENDALMGRPWETPLAAQGEEPPTGVWVSRRGAASFVYELRTANSK